MVHKVMFRHLVVETYQPKNFDVIFSGAREINQIIIRVVQNLESKKTI